MTNQQLQNVKRSVLPAEEQTTKRTTCAAQRSQKRKKSSKYLSNTTLVCARQDQIDTINGRTFSRQPVTQPTTTQQTNTINFNLNEFQELKDQVARLQHTVDQITSKTIPLITENLNTVKGGLEAVKTDCSRQHRRFDTTNNHFSDIKATLALLLKPNRQFISPLTQTLPRTQPEISLASQPPSFSHPLLAPHPIVTYSKQDSPIDTSSMIDPNLTKLDHWAATLSDMDKAQTSNIRPMERKEPHKIKIRRTQKSIKSGFTRSCYHQ